MRHAYLIMAHTNFSQLVKLLQLLDHRDNDIFLHIDKKTGDFPRKELEQACKKSAIFILQEWSVWWGDFSQAECELYLMRYASCTKGGYDYYHLLSGMDFPLKTQEEIHAFFQEHRGKELIHIRMSAPRTVNSQRRASLYYWGNLSSGNPLQRTLKLLVRKAFLAVQLLLGVDREKKDGIRIYFGSQWFSITHGFLLHILEQEEWIRRRFRMVHACDEMIVQTVAAHSKWRDRIYQPDSKTGNLRLIDWERSENGRNPYIFREEDFAELLQSDCLFVRKLDERKDSHIVLHLYQYLKERQEKYAGN